MTVHSIVIVITLALGLWLAFGRFEGASGEPLEPDDEAVAAERARRGVA
ncbi:hypothetical protein [Bradyrhizobium neotropicale]|nr:hypothetical protein [Bradyrhizobium neotropicale]